MNACVPDEIAEGVTHVAGSVVTGQQIGWQSLAGGREIFATRPWTCPPGMRVKVSTELVVSVRAGSFAPLTEEEIPNGRLPATLRHCPWLKVRVAGCDDNTVRPIWMDLGQSVVLPTRGASAAIVGPSSGLFFEVNGANRSVPVPPAAAEQSTIDAWIYVRVEATTCCEPYDVLLTDSATVPDSGLGSVSLIIPPRARCLTIHKGTGSTLGVEWMLDPANLIVGTQGMPGNASQLVLTVPEANQVRLTSGGPPQNVVLVWGLHL